MVHVSVSTGKLRLVCIYTDLGHMSRREDHEETYKEMIVNIQLLLKGISHVWWEFWDIFSLQHPSSNICILIMKNMKICDIMVRKLWLRDQVAIIISNVKF